MPEVFLSGSPPVNVPVPAPWLVHQPRLSERNVLYMASWPLGSPSWMILKCQKKWEKWEKHLLQNCYTSTNPTMNLNVNDRQMLNIKQFCGLKDLLETFNSAVITLDEVFWLVVMWFRVIPICKHAWGIPTTIHRLIRDLHMTLQPEGFSQHRLDMNLQKSHLWRRT